MDVAGRIVVSEQLKDNGNGLFLVGIQHLAVGVYTAVVTVEGQQFMQKVVIER